MAKQAMKVEKARKRAEHLAWAATQMRKKQEEVKPIPDHEKGFSSPNQKRGSRVFDDLEMGDSKIEGRGDNNNNKGGSVDGGQSQTLDVMMMEEEEGLMEVEQPKKKKAEKANQLKPTFDNGLDMLSSDEYIRVRQGGGCIVYVLWGVRGVCVWGGGG